MSYDGPTNYRVLLERAVPAKGISGAEFMPRNTRYKRVDVETEDGREAAREIAGDEFPDYRVLSVRKAKPRSRPSRRLRRRE